MSPSEKVVTLTDVATPRPNPGPAKAADIGLALVAAGGVLAFGGVPSLAYSLMQAAVALLACVAFWRGEYPALPRAAAAVLAMLVTLPLLQSVPLPRALVALLSPARVTIAEKLLAPFDVPLGWPTLSVNNSATLAASLKITCYALVFVLAFHIYRRRRAGLLVPALMALGAFEALYGLVQYLAGWHYIFAYAKRFNLHAATGTYINPNNFAGLLGMSLPFVLAVILFRFPGRESGGRHSWKRFVALQLPGPWMVQVVLFTVMCLALVFSQSRMGLMAALAGLLVVIVLAVQGERRPGRAVALGVLGLPLAFAAWIGLSPVMQRFQTLAAPDFLTEEVRSQFWGETAGMIRDFPLTGVGLGAYQWAFPHYQSETVMQFVDYAHNDYLQFAAELGIPAALVLFAALWVLVARTARHTLVAARTRDKILAAGCAGALVPLLVYSMAEFNFQIPANAFVYAWIAGTAAALTSGISGNGTVRGYDGPAEIYQGGFYR